MKKLYIDVDGVLLTAKETRVADHVLLFIDYIIENFDCYWLTTHCKGDSKSVLNHLSEYFDQQIIEKLRVVQPTSWNTLKTEAIDFTSDFYWIDDNPMQFEVGIINSKSLRDSLIIVDLDRKDELKNIMKMLVV
jgi:hypothetical protein